MFFPVRVIVFMAMLHNGKLTDAMKITLPPQLQQTQVKGLLANPIQDVWVLGTVHIGSESAKEAEILIESIRPTTVVLEVAPSRLDRVRRANRNARQSETTLEKENKQIVTDEMNPSSQRKQTPNVFQLLPALAERGWASGGVSGLIFAVVIVGGSLLKRSMSTNEEQETLPRRDEFAAAIEAADAIDAKIIAADYDIDELIGIAARSLSPINWISLALKTIAEQIGFSPADPIRRQKDESVVQWALRRRNIETARLSRVHGEEVSPEFSKILVDNRDDRFAHSCAKALISDSGPIVCIVGLVHLDGVAQRLSEKSYENQE